MKSVAVALALLLSATAANAQEAQVWAVETPKDADAWLHFGTPETDDHPLAFSCERKSGQVRVAAVVDRKMGVRKDGNAWVDRAGVRAPWPLSISLASEGGSVTLRGAAEPHDPSGGTMVFTEFSTRAPFTEAFRKSGLVRLTAAGQTIEPPPAKKSMVRKFLGACK
ncbi:hypothetical protein [Phenylobacterium koreense]|uniref:Invasion associated locus B family protein n=1 Tax=Phenylobacterium koreense TaxID=266125 RepID=A0ABV2EMS2_9CAUL